MKTVVAVLRGGPTPQYDASLESGAGIIAALNADRYDARDVFIGRDGYWHLGGAVVSPERALRGATIVFNCIHGRYGCDGWLHRIVSKLGHRHVGSGPGPLALAYNKEQAKAIAGRLGFQVPAHKALTRDHDIEILVKHLFKAFPLPAIVKPVGGSGSLGITLATDMPTLHAGIESAFTFAPKILIEELVAGTEASVGVVEHLQEEPRFSFAVGELSAAEKRVLMVMAARMHGELGLSHYSMSDFIVNSRGIWYLETNALPELNEYARFMRGLQGEGVSAEQFAEHVVALARK